jgi:exopolysaccharide biosynthesis polyprenyl glycosylphosphotransferase
MTLPPPSRLRKVVLPGMLVVGDTFVAFASLALGYVLRYHSALGTIGIDVPDATFTEYLPLLLIGAAFLLASYAHLGLYEERLLLRKLQSVNVIIKGTTFWFVAYLSLSLVLKFQPPISRLFVVIAYVCVIVGMFGWRSLAYTLLTRPAWRERLRQRVAVLGWNDEARALVAELQASPAHPYRFCGAIPLPGDDPPPERLGVPAELGEILRRNQIDVLIAARTDLPREHLMRAVEACERAYVEWKIIPSSFQIMLSGLRLQTIGRLPILGVEDIKLERLFHRGAKRLLDLAGALVGLVLSVPVVAVLAWRIRAESPGPILFRQIRIGANNRPFTLYKLRSMRPDASATDDIHQSTTRRDPRLLKIGAFMRKWNLDELPQFWNVLRGDMSLVGPRPERPYHVDRLSVEIPHYLPRHLVKPGMTGWAQINGLRGDTDLAARVQHDIYYIENWSLWLDLQILALTLVRWKNPGG